MIAFLKLGPIQIFRDFFPLCTYIFRYARPSYYITSEETTFFIFFHPFFMYSVQGMLPFFNILYVARVNSKARLCARNVCRKVEGMWTFRKIGNGIIGFFLSGLPRMDACPPISLLLFYLFEINPRKFPPSDSFRIDSGSWKKLYVRMNVCNWNIFRRSKHSGCLVKKIYLLNFFFRSFYE